jgi:hypothetical protein
MQDEEAVQAEEPDEMRLDYEVRGVAVRTISQTRNISERALYKRIRDEGWIPRRARRQRENDSIAERLKVLARRELSSLEQSFAEDRGVLLRIQTIARTVERIFDLEKKEHASRRRKPAPRLIDDARCERLAQRLEGLRRQIELERLTRLEQAP